MLFKTSIFLLTFLFSGLAYSQLMTEKEAQASLSQSCKHGCMLLSKRQLEQLLKTIEEKKQEAFELGVEEGVEAAKNNPKVCPRNV